MSRARHPGHVYAATQSVRGDRILRAFPGLGLTGLLVAVAVSMVAAAFALAEGAVGWRFAGAALACIVSARLAYWVCDAMQRNTDDLHSDALARAAPPRPRRDGR